MIAEDVLKRQTGEVSRTSLVTSIAYRRYDFLPYFVSSVCLGPLGALSGNPLDSLQALQQGP
jgi:hypothetical protein